MFSFNDPAGRCPECEGLGRKIGPVLEKMLDMSKSLNEGAIRVPMFGTQLYQASGFFDNDKKLSDYTPEEMDLLLYGKDRKFKMHGTSTNLTYLGLMVQFDKSYGGQRLRKPPGTHPQSH